MKNKIQWTITGIIAAIIFIVLGMMLGMFPGRLPDMQTSVFAYHGLDAFRNYALFDFKNRSIYYPLGADSNECFTILFLVKIFLACKVNEVTALSIAFFILYTAGYWTLLIALYRMTQSRVVAVGFTVVYFLNPMLGSQVVPVMLGIVFMPVCLLADEVLIGLLDDPKQKVGIKRIISICLAAFLARLILVGIGWYIGVITACVSCGALGMYALLRSRESIKGKCFLKLVWNYLVYVITPWFAAMLIIMMKTAEGSDGFLKGMDFFASNSVDLPTVVLPIYSQYISKWIPTIFNFVPEGMKLAGDGTMWSNYLGAVLLFGGLFVMIHPRVRNKKTVSYFIVACITFALAMGPAFRIMGVISQDAENMYTLPLDEMIGTPWKMLYKLFPLRSMRATYRWIVGTRAVLILMAATGVGYLWKSKKIWFKTMAAVILLVGVFEVWPMDLKTAIAARAGVCDRVRQQEEDITAELRDIIPEGALVNVCTYDGNVNAFMSPMLVTKLGIKTYIGSGDKAMDSAVPLQPKDIWRARTRSDPEKLSNSITKITEYGLCDYILIPYYDMRLGISYWPYDEGWKQHAQEIAEGIKAILQGQYEFYETEHYTVIKCQSQGNGFALSKAETVNLPVRRDHDFAYERTWQIDDGHALDLLLERTENLDSCYLQIIGKAKEGDGTVYIVIRELSEDDQVLNEQWYQCDLTDSYALMEQAFSGLTGTNKLRVTLTTEDPVELKECRVKLFDSNRIYQKEQTP